MATRALPHQRIDVERRFFTGMAITMALVTFIGFAPTYYLGVAFNAKPLAAVTHAHGIVFSAWMLLYVAQNGLVYAGRRDLHRMLGTAGAGLALLVYVLGVWVAIDSGHFGRGAPGRDQPAFLAYPLTNITVFAIMAGTAIWKRTESAAHKRLMLLGTISLVTTPLARITTMLGSPAPPPIGGMILSDLLFAALVTFDLRQRGRLHYATKWFGGAFLLSQPLRVAMSHSEAWQAFARLLLA